MHFDQKIPSLGSYISQLKENPDGWRWSGGTGYDNSVGYNISTAYAQLNDENGKPIMPKTPMDGSDGFAITLTAAGAFITQQSRSSTYGFPTTQIVAAGSIQEGLDFIKAIETIKPITFQRWQLETWTDDVTSGKLHTKLEDFAESPSNDAKWGGLKDCPMEQKAFLSGIPSKIYTAAGLAALEGEFISGIDKTGLDKNRTAVRNFNQDIGLSL